MNLLLLVLASILLTGHTAVAAPFGSVGPEFQVNSYTTDDQGSSAIAVAADPTGNFVVVWGSSDGQDGDRSGVFGQRYDSTGAPVGPEFQVNSYTTDEQGDNTVGVSTDAAGNFVVVWSGTGQGDFDGIFGQRFNSAGNPVGSEFQVNSYTTGPQTFYGMGLSIASDPSGNFVVVWGGEGSGDNQGVFARRFNSLGVPQGGDFLVNTYTTQRQGDHGPAVAADGAGNFVVVWDSGYGQDGDGWGVFGQRFDGAGNPLGAEFQVNTDTTGDQGFRSVAVAADPAGNFLVAWDSVGNDLADDAGVFAQRYNSAGNPVGGEFQVNTYTTGNQGYGGYRDDSYGGIAVAADPAGNFVVVWDSYDFENDTGQDGDAFGVFAQRFDSAGNPVDGEFQINTYTTGNQSVVAVAANGTDRVVVAWSSKSATVEPSQDGSYSGVFAQRFGELSPGLIRGKRFVIRNRTGVEAKRTVTVSGRETLSDIAAIAGDPVANGATLRIIANGTTDSDETYLLDAAGWTPSRLGGFRYRGPTGADGDPVRRVTFTRSPHGTVLLKATLKGSLGTQNLDVVPPNTGDSGGAILTINGGGGTYCIAFGGSAGGQEFRDDAKYWRIANPTAEPGCPAP